MLDEPNWRLLEVGGLYRYEEGVDKFYFTILANHGNDNFTALEHDTGEEQEYSLTGLYKYVFDV